MIALFPAFFDAERRSDAAYAVGSQIAAQEYAKAMARYLTTDVGFFVEESLMPRARYEIGAVRRNYPNAFANVKAYGLAALADILRTSELLAFHDMTGPFLHRQSYVRSFLTNQQFPATTLIHGISYNFALWDMVARMVMSPTLSCDSVICTSVPAQKAFANLVARVVEAIRSQGYRDLTPKFRLDIIPLGVDTDLYRPRPARECRDLLGLPPDKIILLYFGRIDAMTKADLHPLIAIFDALVRKHGDKLCLLLAGNTSQEIVERLHGVLSHFECKNHVLIRQQPGTVEGPLYYSAADVFVSPAETLQESFGITPLEAMSSGLPVVVSNWSGYRDTVLDGKTGFLIPTYWADCSTDISLLSPLYEWQYDHVRLGQSVAVDYMEMFNCLDRLIGNRELRQRLGHSAREHAVANYHWKHIIGQVDDLWHELRAIADKIPCNQPQIPHLGASAYYLDFGHYASHSIDRWTKLRLTTNGLGAARKFPSHLLHNIGPGLFDTTVLHVALKFVRAARMFGQKLTFEEIESRITSKFGLGPDVGRRHVIWLIKYGLLALDGYEPHTI